MELNDYLSALRKRWRSVAWLTLIGVGIAAVLTLLTPRAYEARAQNYVAVSSAISGDSPGAIFQGSQFIVQQVKSYTQLVDSPGVLQPVIDELGLDATVRSLGEDVDATSPLDTVLIDVRARSGDPDQAAQIANAVAASLGRVIEGLETPEEGQAQVIVTTTEPADPPATPVAPRPKINFALGLLAGLGLGVGVAVLREQLDNTIRSADDLQEITGGTALGVIDVDPGTEREPLVTLDQRSPRTEPYRTIRTNLQFVDVDEPPTRFVVTSAAVSEGKTTTACNLAVTYAFAGFRVCLVEGDLRRPQAAARFSVDDEVGLTNVLVGQRSLDDALVESAQHERLTVLPAGTLPPDPGVLLGSRAMSTLLDELGERFDVVIIDAPPLMPVTDAAVISRMVDGAILVARYAHTTRSHLRAAAESLRNADARILGTVITFVPPKWGERAYVHYDRVSSSDDSVSMLPHEPVPRAPASRAGADLHAAAVEPGVPRSLARPDRARSRQKRR